MQPTRRQILTALSEETVSGPDIAANLDISRAAVWKHIEALRDEGFVIDSTADGYYLRDKPEFGSTAIEFGLNAPYSIECHDTIDSTNRRARELADAGENNVVVISDCQTGGRGRLNREWTSPPGGIWLSLLFRPDIPIASAPIYTLGAAVAICETVRQFDIDAGIKWPNDVLIADKKLAGILTEMEGEADQVGWIIVGIGINANIDSDDLPNTATSLQAEIGTISRRTVIQSLLNRFNSLHMEPSTILPTWRNLSQTLGKPVRVETANETICGTAIDIEFPGSLRIQTESGERVVTTGDCEHLRPT